MPCEEKGKPELQKEELHPRIVAVNSPVADSADDPWVCAGGAVFGIRRVMRHAPVS